MTHSFATPERAASQLDYRMVLMGIFRSIAAYYEVLSDNESRLQREGPLLLDCLHRAPGTRVVDLACGTGLHAEFFAQHGARVTAFDLSPEMIAHAQARRPHPGIEYRVGDMRDVGGGPWDLALCLGNSLSVLSRDDIAQTFRNVYVSLAPGGFFLIQVLNYAAESAQQPRHRVERRTRGDTEIIAVKNLVPHADRTLLSLTFYSVQAGKYDSVSESTVLTNITHEQMAALAQQAGFHVEAGYGSFDGSTYMPMTSVDQINLLRKPDDRVEEECSGSS